MMLPRWMIPTLLLSLLLGSAPHAWGGVLAYAAGDVAECNGRPPEKSAAARTAKMIPADAVVLVVGDTTYPRADRATLEECYTPTWGPFLARTYAVPGNHDYVDGSPSDFLDYSARERHAGPGSERWSGIGG